MQKLSKILTFSAIYLTAFCSYATQSELLVSDATIRLLPPGVVNTAVYFNIQNTGDSDRHLVDVTTDIAKNAELHAHIMDGEMMRMEKQQSISVPKGETVTFQPGGYHVMIFGLKKPLSEGQQVEVSLITQNGESVKVKATAVLPGQEKVKKQHHHH